MFTGIVEAVGRVAAVDDRGEGKALTIEALSVVDGLGVGGSVAINGACLTAIEVGESSFVVEAITETLRRTNLGRLEAGSLVNLERAMPAGGRFDGHIVQGHIDMAGSVTAVEPDGSGVRVRIECGSGFMRHVVEKGSITVNGVSLTVSGVDKSGFEFALIPHTLEVTTFGSVSVGDIVNLEADILAKYVERLLRVE